MPVIEQHWIESLQELQIIFSVCFADFINFSYMQMQHTEK